MIQSKSACAGTPAPLRKLSEKEKDLVLKYHGYALSVVFPFQRQWPNWEDELEGAMHFGLIRAVMSFEKSKGLPLDDWIAMKVRFACLGELRTLIARAARTEQLVTEDLQEDDCEEGAWATANIPAVNSDATRAMEEAESMAQFEAELAKIPASQAEIVRFVTAEGYSISEAARRLGLSHNGAKERYAKGINGLRNTHR